MPLPRYRDAVGKVEASVCTGAVRAGPGAAFNDWQPGQGTAAGIVAPPPNSGNVLGSYSCDDGDASLLHSSTAMTREMCEQRCMDFKPAGPQRPCVEYQWRASTCDSGCDDTFEGTGAEPGDPSCDDSCCDGACTLYGYSTNHVPTSGAGGYHYDGWGWVRGGTEDARQKMRLVPAPNDGGDDDGVRFDCGPRLSCKSGSFFDAPPNLYCALLPGVVGDRAATNLHTGGISPWAKAVLPGFSDSDRKGTARSHSKSVIEYTFSAIIAASEPNVWTTSAPNVWTTSAPITTSPQPHLRMCESGCAKDSDCEPDAYCHAHRPCLPTYNGCYEWGGSILNGRRPAVWGTTLSSGWSPHLQRVVKKLTFQACVAAVKAHRPEDYSTAEGQADVSFGMKDFVWQDGEMAGDCIALSVASHLLNSTTSSAAAKTVPELMTKTNDQVVWNDLRCPAPWDTPLTTTTSTTTTARARQKRPPCGEAHCPFVDRNGRCNQECNNLACGHDGGECTVNTTPAQTTGNYASLNYASLLAVYSLATLRGGWESEVDCKPLGPPPSDTSTAGLVGALFFSAVPGCAGPLVGQVVWNESEVVERKAGAPLVVPIASSAHLANHCARGRRSVTTTAPPNAATTILPQTASTRVLDKEKNDDCEHAENTAACEDEKKRKANEKKQRELDEKKEEQMKLVLTLVGAMCVLGCLSVGLVLHYMMKQGELPGGKPACCQTVSLCYPTLPCKKGVTQNRCRIHITSSANWLLHGVMPFVVTAGAAVVSRRPERQLRGQCKSGTCT